MEKITEWYRHGDVRICRVEEIPQNSEKLGTNVLREGEVTGHRHQVIEPDATIYMHTDIMYLDAPSGATVTHQEHSTQKVPPGKYMVLPTREVDHFRDEMREVAD